MVGSHRFTPRFRPSVVVAALAVVLVAEVLLRWSPSRDLLPRPVSYYSDNVENRLRVLEGACQRGPIDLLAVGSSVVRANLRPDLLEMRGRQPGHLRSGDMPSGQDQAGRPQPERHQQAFNFGLSGLAPDQVRLYLEHLLLRRAEPRAVIQGIRFPELVIGRGAAAFGDMPRARIERLWLAGGRLSRWRSALTEHVSLLRYRGMLTDFWSRFRWPPGRALGFAIDERGWGPSAPRTGDSVSVASLKSHAGPWPAANAEAGLAALASSADLCRARGIPFAVFDVPEHPGRWQGDEARALRRRYRETLGRWSLETGVPVLFVDSLSELWGDARWYVDGHHMTREGAGRFTADLAARLADTAWPAGPPRRDQRSGSQR